MSETLDTPFGPSLQSLIDMQDCPAVLIDEGYRIVAANRAYQLAYGVDTHQLIGRTCHEVSHHRDSPCHLHGEDCPHLQVFSQGQAQRVLHTHFDGRGQPEYVSIKGHPVMLPDGKMYLGESIQRLTPPDQMNCEDMRIVGRSPALLRTLDQLTHAGASNAAVLLQGESGVGKELAARYLHDHSACRHKPFVAVDCATLSENLFESEMFGHEAGAFTGCGGRKLGLFEMAKDGTLFLDEIGEIPPAMQAKLLRVLETGSFRRVGGRETLHADVRLVTATNRDLQHATTTGRFRADLYYRIACITVALPALRERQSDIPMLAEALLTRINAMNGSCAQLTEGAHERLLQYDFPGNIRELRNILQRASALCHDNTILAVDLGLPDTLDVGRPRSVRKEGDFEQDRLQALARQYSGNRRAMAAALGVSERTLYRHLRRYRARSSSKI